jgi:hypothetical protein
MSTQNLSNHARFVVPYHVVLFLMLLAGLIGGCVNLYQSIGDPQRVYSAALLVLLTTSVTMATFFARLFALRAQDRAIRAEENLRHFVMTGKLLDPRVTMSQVIGLRFASDAEFLALATRAADEAMSQQDIKKAIQTWRADEDRV